MKKSIIAQVLSGELKDPGKETIKKIKTTFGLNLSKK